jgi:hypothetical protein
MRSGSIPHANTSRRSKYSNRCGRQIAGHTVCLLLVTQTDQFEKAHSELEVFVREREHELKERGDMPPLNSLEPEGVKSVHFYFPNDLDASMRTTNHMVIDIAGFSGGVAAFTNRCVQSQ